MSSANASASRAERQLEVTQAITHIGSWEWDVRTNVVTWSDELYRIYGLEPRSREVTLEFFLSCLDPRDRERVQNNVREALTTRSRFAYPERIVRPDGTVRQLDTIGEVALDERGEAVGLIGTCRDVTEDLARDEQIRLYADIVQNVQIGLSVWEVDEPGDIANIRLVAYNPACESITHLALEKARGASLLEIAPFAGGGDFERLLVAVARDRSVRSGAVARSRDPSYPNRALSLKAFPLEGRRVGLAIEDVTDQTVARRLQEAEQRLFEMIASGAPLAEVLKTLVLAIEEHSPPTIASILLLDSAGRHIRRGAAPNLPDSYNEAIEGAPIGPRAGSCGTAAFVGRAVFAHDIETDPLWNDYRDVAREHGLRACWSTPILTTDGRVLGTFALYYRERREPAESDRSVIARATHIAGIAIERQELEDQLRDLSAHVESVREDERTGIAREIHDQLGQALTALKMDLAWIGRRASADALPREALLEKVRGMSDMIDEVIGQVRRISAELRPGVLDDLGLRAALEWQADEFAERTGLTCSLESNVGDEHLERRLSTAIFRIFQEALTNVARHAEASHIDVRLVRDGRELVFEVHDDGKGISLEAARNPKSLGLLGMRERARRLGGTLKIAAVAPHGTSVSVTVPWQHPAGGSS